MKLHELSPAPGSTKSAWRKGRGVGSGNGKTAGRGHKGQNARTVVIQHIVTKGTIDERILKALQAKDKTQAALIEAVKADLKI